MERAFIVAQVARKEEQLPPLQWDPGSAHDVLSAKSCGRNIFRLLFWCFSAQNVRQFPEGSKHAIPPKESSPVSKPNLPQVLLCQYSRIPDIWLLPEIETQVAERFCLVIDLDETLIHSSFKPIDNADFIVPLKIEGVAQQAYVFKRPYVDEFLQRMGELFECVLFTASLAKYADPVTDLLDKWGVFRARLFRESCVFHQGSYVKDLSRLGRDLNKIVIIDNSPASYIFHPDNAIVLLPEECYSGSSLCSSVISLPPEDFLVSLCPAAFVVVFHLI
ncbi:carboxy-terminal domain RNA polymerase II polypeptide A small phosphatase 2-like isoform X1 [Scyliorhinus canicula]|uniref:carboxy-terminal domain RNA polymerase II polypeptide A small phosphatase 2-like isoform X1 n=1 Tax=Scyliorhinus canicula TaxID=7830 RepID=UPI0018F40A38|nr:carboxy-terminal domain RNA polymerase II polypeptide A small phosphatase 2-like isoform X1 [Scyliorhinus canicula]